MHALLTPLPPSLPPSSPPFFSGEPGDRVQFSEFVAANVRLHALRTDTRLSTSAVAHFTRGELATALRKVRGAKERGGGDGARLAPFLSIHLSPFSLRPALTPPSCSLASLCLSQPSAPTSATC